MSHVGAPDAGTRLHVLIVAPSMDRLLGGQEVQGDQLLREWRGDADVDAVLVESNPQLPPIMRIAERLPALRTLLRLPFRAIAIARALRRADVVHVFAGSHSSFLVATLPTLLAARLRGVPSIVHYHSSRGDEHLASSALARCALKRCAAVVVPSRYLAEVFARHGVPTTIIANVVDAARFRFRGSRRPGTRLICSRNLASWYGVDIVIRAFAIVRQSVPTATLSIAGSGPEEPALRELVRSLAIEGVTFLGAVPRDAMGALLDDAAIFVNASRIDNMPVSIMEAFACGVPVVTTAAGGIATMVRDGENALVVPPDDAPRLAALIVSILQDPSLAERLAGGARRDAERWTWNAVRAEWLSLYRRVAATRVSSERYRSETRAS